jgi:hypothetical protein
MGVSMSKSAVLLLVLFFLSASCLIGVKYSSVASAAENSWATKAPIPQAERGVRAAVVNGKIYVMGGSINYEYDPVTAVWVEKTPMPTPRNWFGIAVYQNKIYAMGGRTCMNVLEVYDPLRDTWESMEPIPVNISDIDVNVVNGKIYLIGQVGSQSLNMMYDIAEDSWSNKTTMPYPACSYATTAVVNSKIYLIGAADTLLTNYTQIYDPRTDSWSLGASIPTPLYNVAVVATTGVMASKRIYVIGGNSFLEGTGATQVYDPVSDSWTLGASMSTARLALAVAVVNDQIYAIAGRGMAVFSPVLTTNEQYTPFGYGTADPSYDDTPPEIAVSSPENTTYYSANVTLGFVVNEQASWMGYSLDGSDKVTIGGNVTLSGLSLGVHNVTVYAWDVVGNAGASETITFTIADPFPIVTIAAASVLAVVSVALLIYFTKRRQKMASH